MKIFFATSNQDKIKEAHTILSELGHSVEELRINGKFPNFIEPQSSDLKEVAASKLKQAIALIEGTELEDYAIMVEDSGLFIDQFPGFPGVFSSFVYESVGLNGILNLLEKSTNRSAEYRSVTLLHWKNKIWKFILRINKMLNCYLMKDKSHIIYNDFIMYSLASVYFILKFQSFIISS